MRTLTTVLTTCCLLFFFTSCEKEYSFENGGTPGSGNSTGSAVYTFGGGGGNCTSAVVNGTYNVGVPLDASNTVVIQVNVTTAGTYTVSTINLNGISFTGTGTFSATGTQFMTLTGSGTPTANGTFSYIPGNTGCIFSVLVTNGGGGGGGGANDFLKCNIDGAAKTFNVSLAAANIGNVINISGDETAATGTPSLSITLSKGVGSAVTTGVYKLPSLTNLTNICAPDYSDGVAVTSWTGGTAGQTNDFEVTVTSVSASRIEGTFSGSVYGNNGAGTTAKVITSGSFSVGL
jgi:hypothetical protein